MTITIILITILALGVGFGLGWFLCYKKYKKEIKSYGEYTKILETAGKNSELYKLTVKVVDDKNDSDISNDEVELYIDKI